MGLRLLRPVIVKLALGLGVIAGFLVVTVAASGSFSGTSPAEDNTVTAAPVDHLSISPSSASVAAGQSQTYTVHATGVSPGNIDYGDVTSNATFTITSGGTCTGASCSSTASGTYTVTAHYWGLTVTATLTVTAATATKLVFTTQPGNDGESNAGDVLSVLPVVTVEDQYGNVVTTDSSTVTLSITSGTPTSGGPGALSACTQSEAAGVVTFDGCSIDAAGTGYKLHATDGSLTARDSAAFTVGTASPSLTISHPDPPTTSPAGTTISASSIAAQLSSSSGANYTQTITFIVFGPQSSPPTVCSSGGTLVGTASPTGDGRYQSSGGFTPTIKGSYWWYASSSSDANNDPAASTCGAEMTETTVGFASPALTISNPNPPSTDSAGTTISGSSIATQLTGSSGSNYTPTITFTVFGPQNSPPTNCTSGGTVVGTATAVGNGTYKSSGGFTPTVAGKYWWYVSSPSDANNNAAASSCGSTMTQTVAANGSKLVFTTSAQSTYSGFSSGVITVQRQDQYNNPATNGALTINLSSSSIGGVFRNSGDTTNITNVTISDGTTSASFRYKDTLVGTPTITAADAAGTLTSATQQETILASASRLAFTTTAVSGIASSTANMGVITVQRQDPSNNPVTAGTTVVNLASSSSGATSFSLTPNGPLITSVTIAAPASSVSFYYGDTIAGSPTITGSDNGGVLVSATQQESVSAAPPSQLSFTTASQTLVTGQVSNAVTIQQLDQFGNPTVGPSVSAELSTSSTSGQFLDFTGSTAITAVTIPNGAGSASFTYEDTVGTPTITASVTGGALSSASQSETVNQASTTASVSSDDDYGETSQLLTYTAMVAPSSAGSGTPTGYMEFLDGGTPIADCGGASGEPLASGTAYCQTEPAVGTHAITSRYLGDSNYSSSPPSSAVSTVIATPALTLSNLKTGSWNAAATWTSSPNGTITSAANSCSVTGTGTSFSTQLTVGSLLYNGTTKIGTVATIASDTSLTMSTSCTHAVVTNIAYSVRRVPTAADAVTLVGGYVVTVPASYSAVAASLSLNPAQSGANTQLTVASTGILTVAGDVTLDPSTTKGFNTILKVGAGTVNIGGGLNFVGLTGNSGQCLEADITSGSLTIAGNVTMDNTGTATSCTATSGFLTPTDLNDITMSSAGTLNFGGSVTITNPSSSTIQLASSNTSVVNFDGIVPQTVPVPASTAWIYSNVDVNNTSGGGATLGGALTATNETRSLSIQSGTFSNGGFAIGLATSKTFQVANGATFTLVGTSGMVTGTTITTTFGASSTVTYAGSAQTIASETYGNLTLSGSGVKTMPGTAMAVAGSFAVSGTASATAGQNLTVSGNFSVGSGATFNAGSYSHSVAGNFFNRGTFTAGTSTFTLSGSGATIAGSSTTFNNLTLSNYVSLAGVSGANVTVSGTLELAANILTTGAHTVIASGTVTRTGASSANGFVDGSERKPITTGASSPSFEVGTGSTYAPISLSIIGASANGNLTASSTAGLEPAYSTSGMSQTQYVNRYWSFVAGGGLSVSAYSATFTFDPSDLAGSPDTSALNVKVLTGSTWTAPASISSTSTTVTGTGFGTAFGQYASGS